MEPRGEQSRTFPYRCWQKRGFYDTRDYLKSLIGGESCKMGSGSDCYGVTVVTEKVKMKDNGLSLTRFDFFFDIKVSGGTYAKMWCGEGSPDETDGYDPENRKAFDMDSCVRLDESGKKLSTVFTLHDVNRTNPLFRALRGSHQLKVYTNGDTIQYSGGRFEFDIAEKLCGIENPYMVNEIQNHIFLNGQPSYAFPMKELMDFPENNK